MKGKRQGKNGHDRTYIRTQIERTHYEALKKESIGRRVTMNYIIREMLEGKYGKAEKRWHRT